jgi:transketolase
MVACKTHIALGSSAQDTSKGHGALTDAKLIADTRKAAYGWDTPPSRSPPTIKAKWEAIGARGAAARAAWEARFAAPPPPSRPNSAASSRARCPARCRRDPQAEEGGRREPAEARHPQGLRKGADAINPVDDRNLGGSADLTGSNNTKTADLGIFGPATARAATCHYGIREHGMAAAMNGMALHGGIRPYGGTFMCFTDYARPRCACRR